MSMAQLSQTPDGSHTYDYGRPTPKADNEEHGLSIDALYSDITAGMHRVSTHNKIFPA
jgi:hypothetical protein